MNINGHLIFKTRPLKDLLHHFGHQFYHMTHGNESNFKAPHVRDLINFQIVYMKELNLHC
jgi:hypothetical protein